MKFTNMLIILILSLNSMADIVCPACLVGGCNAHAAVSVKETSCCQADKARDAEKNSNAFSSSCRCRNAIIPLLPINLNGKRPHQSQSQRDLAKAVFFPRTERIACSSYLTFYPLSKFPPGILLDVHTTILLI